MTQHEFENEMKVFKRFLKENGVYHFIIKYLFPKNRNKEELFKTLNHNNYTSMRELFNFEETLGPSYNFYGHGFWKEHIRDIHYKWKNYASTFNIN